MKMLLNVDDSLTPNAKIPEIRENIFLIMNLTYFLRNMYKLLNLDDSLTPNAEITEII